MKIFKKIENKNKKHNYRKNVFQKFWKTIFPKNMLKFLDFGIFFGKSSNKFSIFSKIGNFENFEKMQFDELKK